MFCGCINNIDSVNGINNIKNTWYYVKTSAHSCHLKPHTDHQPYPTLPQTFLSPRHKVDYTTAPPLLTNNPTPSLLGIVPPILQPYGTHPCVIPNPNSNSNPTRTSHPTPSPKLHKLLQLTIVTPPSVPPPPFCVYAGARGPRK